MRWSEEKAWDWYNRKPWIRGCNYRASDCINWIEQWQELDFDKKMQTFDRELKLAADIGFNSIRTLLSFEVWDQQHDGFMDRLEQFLTLAASHGISVMPIFGNDCCVPKELYQPARMGRQPEPEPGYHGGRKDGTHAVMHDKPAYSILDDAETARRFERFVDEVVGRYAKDQRIIIWDIFNEPGMTRRGSLSLPHMVRFFEIARSHDPIQPLTAGAWDNLTGTLSEIEQKAVDLSDVVSFHSYDNYIKMIEILDTLGKYKRPLLNTEWLHRCWNNRVEEMFPLFYLMRIGCYNWGLVAGKSQTFEPWEKLYHDPDPSWDLTKWQHDLFRQNLRPYDPKEIQVIRHFCALSKQKQEICQD